MVKQSQQMQRLPNLPLEKQGREDKRVFSPLLWCVREREHGGGGLSEGIIRFGQINGMPAIGPAEGCAFC